VVRSILAVLLGMAVWAVLWIASNQALTAAMPEAFGDEGLLLENSLLWLYLLDSVVLSVLAGWVTGRVAGRRQLAHGLALGLAQLAIGVAVQASAWDDMPLWYHLAFLALLIPASVLGANLARTGAAQPD
jgi:hypothetical protein